MLDNSGYFNLKNLIIILPLIYLLDLKFFFITVKYRFSLIFTI